MKFCPGLHGGRDFDPMVTPMGLETMELWSAAPAHRTDLVKTKDRLEQTPAMCLNNAAL
jgi:hypothetical protein